MGLAPYGNPLSPDIKKYVDIIKKDLVSVKEDGSVWLNQDFFDYATGLKMVNESKWQALFGFKTRKPEDELEQHHCNLGLAIQQITEDVVVLMAQEAKRLTGSENICLAGGVALNCVSNGKLQKSGVFKNVFIQPAAGDAGGALGAALAVNYIYFKQERVIDYKMDAMMGSYLGPTISDLEVELMSKKYKANYQYFENFDELAAETAKLISQENVIGWVQGKMEFGPRALGARSILGDPRSAEMQKKLNLKIKYRESFRPFAPSVLAQDVSKFFDYDGISPYMLLVHPVADAIKKTLPEGYDDMNLRDKLYHLRSELPSITHIDFSARIQTVHSDTNPRYYKMIEEFKKLTGMGVVVNTSFNVRGEPIVMTPNDAYRCFMRTEMDYLVVGNFLFSKKDQPEWQGTDNWKEEFVLD
jgi:carbamoyltransferase